MTTETGDGDQRRRISRLVFRCVSRFLVEEAARLIAVHDRDFVRAMIFLAVRQATRAGQEARSVSVRAIAQSLNSRSSRHERSSTFPSGFNAKRLQPH